MIQTIIEFLAQFPARVSYGNAWMVADVDEKGDIYFTVYFRPSHAKKAKRLYEGHNLADALWCLEHEEEYK